jgi:hypothetical protein
MSYTSDLSQAQLDEMLKEVNKLTELVKRWIASDVEFYKEESKPSPILGPIPRLETN